MNIRRIDELNDLPDKSPDYVFKQVETRTSDIDDLPDEVLDLLSSNKTLIDIGPGEGISSMALASLYPNLSVSGIEMDQKHLTSAWPLCTKYSNLNLYFGALPGTPSNVKVDVDTIIPQVGDVKTELLFSWTGISRRDLFDHAHKWHHIVEKAAIFIVPSFWRQGFKTFKEHDEINELLKDLGADQVTWDKVSSVEGFKSIEVYPLDNTLKARGWILWLSGIFDDLNVSFWNTLTDRWRDKAFQLEALEIPLEVIILRK
ncbi:hypothetical protein EZV73_20485 [Acidaminobacter sp. JC074]|uniref:hypothetical protein n=1 Tax=Acidaminobacter sp. JC074 TaxID=2530199 RepID=UPI001F1005EF|nr:hypothetical protein [Acidaminobacter sp. JC074]MCH4889969.1 hypothetical protein [Acidaminobacter sp. JC074]